MSPEAQQEEYRQPDQQQKPQNFDFRFNHQHANDLAQR
jgi:hypothetical protein